MRALLAAALTVAGCQGAHVQPDGHHSGFVYVDYEGRGPMGGIGAVAHFGATPSVGPWRGECAASAQAGPCGLFVACPRLSRSLDAGWIRIDFSGGTVIQIPSDPYAVAPVGYRVAAGESMRVTAPGAMVPGFAASLIVPAAPATTILPAHVSQSADLVVSLPRMAADQIVFGLYGVSGTATPETQIVCVVPSSTTSIVIPRSMVEAFRVGDQVGVRVGAVNMALVEAGEFSIEVDVQVDVSDNRTIEP